MPLREAPMRAAAVRVWLLLFIPLALGGGGCKQRTSPSPSGNVDATANAPSSSAPAASAVRPPPAAGPGENRDEGPPGEPPSGGPWTTCFEGFRTSNEPLRDVTRLGLLCGPATGMKRPRAPELTRLRAGEPWRFSLPLAKGECFRVFATSSLPARLTMSTSGPAELTSTVAHGEGFVVSRPRGPLCATEATVVTASLVADRDVEAAVAPWILPP